MREWFCRSGTMRGGGLFVVGDDGGEETQLRIENGLLMGCAFLFYMSCFIQISITTLELFVFNQTEKILLVRGKREMLRVNYKHYQVEFRVESRFTFQ